MDKLKAKNGAMFWDLPPCSSAEVHPRFGGTYCYRLQVRRVDETRSRQESEGKYSQYDDLTTVTLNPLLVTLYFGKNVHGTACHHLYFYHEDGSKILLRNIDVHLSDHTAAFFIYNDRHCALVVRVIGYRYRGPSFDS
jgi:hypothetical protein